MEPVNSLSSPPPRTGSPRPQPVESGPVDDFRPTREAAPEEKPRHGKLKKVLAGALLATAVAGVGTGAAAHTLANAPICPHAEVDLGWSDGGLCVSPELGTQAGTLWRYIEAMPHLPSTIHDFSSSQNQVLHPEGDASPPAQLMDDGELDVISWNLHHGLGRDSEGARPQIETIERELREAAGDVYLLQEVAPQDAQDIVNALGMDGYFSATSGVQGNLILVHPDLQVTDHHQAFIAGEGLWDWAIHGGGASEPRSIQTVEVELPGGRDALLWNTHYPTHVYSPEQKQEALERLVGAIEEHSEPGTVVIGGGDLNSHEEESLPQALIANGHTVNAHNIDYVVTRNVSQVSIHGQKLENPDGTMISDHPIVEAKLRI